MIKEIFTKYEIARIYGARALQISMDAPLLIKIEKEELEKINYNPLKIAEMEFKSGVLPITVKRPFPQKRDVKIKKTGEQMEDEEKKKEDEEIEEKKKKEEKEIIEKGEIMEMAKPIDEVEETEEEEEEGLE